MPRNNYLNDTDTDIDNDYDDYDGESNGMAICQI